MPVQSKGVHCQNIAHRGPCNQKNGIWPNIGRIQYKRINTAKRPRESSYLTCRQARDQHNNAVSSRFNGRRQAHLINLLLVQNTGGSQPTHIRTTTSHRRPSRPSPPPSITFAITNRRLQNRRHSANNQRIDHDRLRRTHLSSCFFIGCASVTSNAVNGMRNRSVADRSITPFAKKTPWWSRPRETDLHWIALCWPRTSRTFARIPFRAVMSISIPPFSTIGSARRWRAENSGSRR